MISIIIPVYNHGEELSKCLDSIFKQSLLTPPYPPLAKGGSVKDTSSHCQAWNDKIEVIVVNDGSTDETKAVLEEYCSGLNRTTPQPPSNTAGRPPQRGVGERAYAHSDKVELRIIHQSNQGAPAARNRGFQESKGEYIIFCDADVVLREDALEKMLGALEEGDSQKSIKPIKSVKSVENFKFQKGDVLYDKNPAYVYPSFKFGWKKFTPGQFSAEKLKEMNYIHTTALIRRECFPENGFDTKLRKFQDWDLWLTMLENGHCGIWLPEILFTVKPRRAGMSEWLPSFMYNIPWKKFGIKIRAIEEYDKWRDVVRGKHGLE